MNILIKIHSIIVSVLLMSACGGKNASNSSNLIYTSEDTVTAVDTISTKHVKQPSYLSDNLKELGIKGQVKSVNNEFSGSTYVYCFIDNFPSFSFDENGNRISPKKYDCFRFQKNDDGYIYKTWTDYGSSDGSEQTTDFVLNDDGWPVSGSWVEEGPAAREGKIKFSVSYSDIDEHGNWTTRKTTTPDGTAICKRTIYYYK